MGVWLGPRGVPKYKKPPAFTYTGSYEYHEDTAGSDGTVNWQIVFLTSGTLRFSRVVENIDVFLVGHGETGHQGYYSSPFFHGGKGGHGGALKTASGVPVSAGINYSIVIPAEGSPTTASFRNDCTAASGGGVDGGAGAYVADNNPFNAVAGSQGGLSFGGNGDRSGYRPTYRYGASGGGGGAGSPNGTRRNGGGGGTSDGGTGGNYNGDGGSGGNGNSGAGGGGGGKNVDTEYLGGAGGPGIVIIRNAR